MIHGINPSMPSPQFPPPNNAQLTKWANQVEGWMNEHPESKLSTMFAGVRQELDNYIHGIYPFQSIEDVLNDLQEKNFKGVGQLDVYANSGLGDPQPVQDFMELFGLTPPPITQMDTLIMNFQKEFYSGLPKGGDALLTDLHDHLLEFGSNGLADFQTWAKQEKNQNAYKIASPEAQALFQQFIK